jgi:transcription-repair coupling factor (superfamily II helicase)
VNGDGKANGKPKEEPITPIQLVTLDLPLTAYLPTGYVPDDTLRLRVYQKLVNATTTEQITQLRAELRDRFGALPAPAEQLLLWLEFKALALQAGVPSIATGEDEITIRLPANSVIDRTRLQRRFSDEQVRVGPQFVRINRRTVKERWMDVLRQVLENLNANSEARAPISQLSPSRR